jgi:protein tyrosine/serine phosphatase
MYVDDLIAAERAAAEKFGATYIRTADLDYGHWRDTIREHPEPGPEWEKAAKNVARLIKEQVLMPGGKPPRGNILLHCGGGMHRTGMIIGILQKVINGTKMAEIENSYRYHVSYKSESQKGGFEQENLDFINEFKQEYLR